MPNTRKPRSGSLQFWPRKRSVRNTPRIRTQPVLDKEGIAGFLGYKVGMTHVIAVEANKKSHKKGEEISVPVTLVEVPPVKIGAVRFYKNKINGIDCVSEIVVENKDKGFGKTVNLPKKSKSAEIEKISEESYDDIRVLVYTQPGQVGFGKKKADVVELSLGGSKSDKLKFVKENIGKDIVLNSVFEEGELVDLKSVTKGKGFQGPVKRFGVTIRQAKSEKAIRNPGSLGPWCGQGHIMWRVAHAGKMGFHQRTEYNKQIIKVYEDPKEITLKGGMLGYGVPKSMVVAIKGSVSGSRKRLVVFTKPMRVKKQKVLPTVLSVSLEEKQGN